MILKDGRWYSGARVEVVNLKETSYIQTDCDPSTEFYLENLPKFG